MLRNFVCGSVVIAVFISNAAFGQDGQQCLKDVLDYHSTAQRLAALTQPKPEIPVQESECHQDGRHFVCAYTDFTGGPTIPSNLAASFSRLTECFKKTGRRTSNEFGLDGDEPYELPKERCVISKPLSFAGWSFMASCSLP